MKSRWRAPRVSASDGFTLIELLVSMVAGIVVVLATFATFDASVRQSLAASDRVEATQNGRIAMEKLVQELNSSCVWSTVPPVQAGSDATHVWFLTAFSSVPLPNPILHQVWLTGSGVLEDASYTLLNPQTPPGSWTSSAFNSTPTSTRVLARGISYITGSSALFQYYQYVNGHLAIDPAHQLSAPLDTTTAPLVGAVSISYAAAPSSNSAQADRTINLTDTADLSPPPGPGGGCQ
jgi:type II secretory pathway pseudopilin PulG